MYAHLGVYLSAYLAPFQHWLADENVTEILVNRPDEVWTESAGAAGMARHEAPGIDDVLLSALRRRSPASATRASTASGRCCPPTLPTGERIQIVSPPATRRHFALSIRRHRLLDVPLDAYERETKADTRQGRGTIATRAPATSPSFARPSGAARRS